MMTLVQILLLSVAVLIGGAAAWVRFAPSDPELWHVAPLRAADPGRAGYLLMASSADNPVLEADTSEVLRALDGIARATARTKVLTGSVAEGRITYITRSRFWGFPDYTSVTATDVTGGSQLVIFARLRFGRSDLGVNKARVLSWMAQLRQAL
ncbi:DUF1499 domain-containing protein [Candidatus Halocynthiibacter alkanivorans]|jgi:Protein of unknown function (DUF1499)|uniref:DUF1499 domain-containing protein n=1 Tax=Candidatus Halocynthiibacter alkanivorans TaxID=2267619 RepID=UPI003012CFB0